MDVQFALELGQQHPYDTPDSSAPLPPTDWAHAAARGVIADLTDRRAIKWGFDDVDEEVRAEIVSTMAEIIREAFRKGCE